MVKAIITDFDGTLVDTFEANWKAYERAFSEVGLSITLEEYKKVFGSRFDDFMKMIGISDTAVAKRIRDLKTKYYPTYFNELIPNKKLIEKIKELRLNGGKTAIASTARKENLKNALTYLQLLDMFDLIYSASDVTNGKPNPEIYIRTMEHLGVTSAETLIYEDSEVGVQAAKASGAKYVRVTHDWFEND